MRTIVVAFMFDVSTALLSLLHWSVIKSTTWWPCYFFGRVLVYPYRCIPEGPQEKQFKLSFLLVVLTSSRTKTAIAYCSVVFVGHASSVTRSSQGVVHTKFARVASQKEITKRM